MTNHAPIDQPIVEILNAYNPLEIKDILLNGSWRKATHHKEWDDVLAYYKSTTDTYTTTCLTHQKHGIITA